LLELDFQNLGFIRPAGVVFLSNLLWWLQQQGTSVHLVNANRDPEVFGHSLESRPQIDDWSKNTNFCLLLGPNTASQSASMRDSNSGRQTCQ